MKESTDLATWFASPGQEYLEKIGILAYGISSLEWICLGDLSKHEEVIPSNVRLELLAGNTTGGIAKKLIGASNSVTDEKIANFIRVAGEVLEEAANLRNPVLHARPATHSTEGQRLYRWIATEQYWIDNEELDNKISRLFELKTLLADARV